MSANSGQNPLDEIKPTQRVESYLGMGRGKKNLVFTVKGPKKAPEIPPLEAQVQSLPTRVCEFFNDTQTTSGLLDLLGITSNSISLIDDSSGAIPYLGLFSSPSYLYHGVSKACERFQIVADAVKVKRTSDAFFWTLQGLDASSAVIGTLSKNTSSLLTLLGFSSFAVFGIIFSLVMPILLTVLGAVGGMAAGFSLWRNARAIKHYESLRELSETLEYLQGPKTRLEKEDRDTDKAALAALHNIEVQNFKSTHFSSDPRSLYIKQKLDKIQGSIRAQKGFAFQMKDELRDVFNSMKDLEEIFQQILTMKEGDEFRLIEDMHYLYDKLAANHNLNEELRAMMDQNRKDLRRLLAVARRTTGEANSDMHRTLAYNALFLLMSVILVADYMLYLIAPQHAAISTYMSIGIAVLDIAVIIFDKNIEIEQFHRLREMLEDKP